MIMKTCLILPAYNESQTIETVISQSKKFIQTIVVVDDGSIDETAHIAQKSGATVIHHKTNLGKGMALRAGFDWAIRNQYDVVMTMDSDGQHNPLDLPRFLDKLKNDNPDIILGIRQLNRTMPLHRQLNNRLVSAVGSWLCGKKIDDFQCGYRLIKAEVIKKIELKTMRYETEAELLVKAGKLGFKFGMIPIKTIYNGQISNIKPIREIYLFTKLLFALLNDR